MTACYECGRTTDLRYRDGTDMAWCQSCVDGLRKRYADEPVRVRGLFTEPASECRHGVRFDEPSCVACWLEMRTRP